MLLILNAVGADEPDVSMEISRLLGVDFGALIGRSSY
jgi:hypothetical protein